MKTTLDAIAAISGGGFTGLILLAFRAVYRLGAILESFREHKTQSDDYHKRLEDRVSYLERQRA
jgi:hypothetical protein